MTTEDAVPEQGVEGPAAGTLGKGLVPLVRSMGVMAGMAGMGNPWRDDPDEIARKCQGMPLVRVHATGIAAGPEDPGGRYWVIPLAATSVVGLWLLGRRGRKAKEA
jgi:hypothetical protein